MQDKGYLPLLIAEEIAALSRLSDYVQDARTIAAARQLNRARVFLFARGNAEALAVLMDRRLRRMGIATVVLRGDACDLAEQSLTLGAEDAVLLFAFRRQPRDYERLAYQGWRAGTRTPQGGETWEAFRGRVCSAVDGVHRMQAETVLMVCHGGVIRALLDGLIGLPPRRILPVGPASLTVLAFRNGQAKLEALNVTPGGLSLDAPD